MVTYLGFIGFAVMDQKEEVNEISFSPWHFAIPRRVAPGSNPGSGISFWHFLCIFSSEEEFGEELLLFEVSFEGLGRWMGGWRIPVRALRRWSFPVGLWCISNWMLSGFENLQSACNSNWQRLMILIFVSYKTDIFCIQSISNLEAFRITKSFWVHRKLL